MKATVKIISVFMSFVLFIGIFPSAATVFAQEYNENLNVQAYKDKLLSETVSHETTKAEILCEVTEKRDEYSKTYKRADGSFTTVFSSVPLHSFKDGKWSEIDNSLQTENDVIKNADGVYNIEFPETITENEKITVTNDGESIAFSINDINDSSATVTTSETDENDIIENDLSKTVSEITYESVDDKTDVQYVVSSGYVKENIIVNDESAVKDSYSFEIEKGNLTVILDENNSVIFKNEKNEVVFTIPAPLMSDAENALSYDIGVSVSGTDKSVFTLTYTPAKDWLNSKDRVYPVVIDPVIVFPSSEDLIIEDTVIMSKESESEAKTTNYSNSSDGIISDTDEVKSNVLVKLNMGAFSGFKKSNVEITRVDFLGDGFINGGNALLKPIVGAWNSQTITYADVFPENNAESVITYENTVTDYFTGTSPQGTSNEATNVHFNITSLFKEWLSGERENTGFAIVPESPSVNGYMFIGGEYAPQGTVTHTFSSYCSVDYVDTSGNNDSFEYLTQEIGRAGAVNVNVFSRGLSLTRSDLSMDGLRMPVNVQFNYNSALSDYLAMFNAVNELYGEAVVVPPYGENWSCSYLQMLTELVEGQYMFYTSEGTLVTFNQKEETVTSDGDGESTEATEIVFEADEGSDAGYYLELKNQEDGLLYTNMTLTNPSGEVLSFNDDGFVTHISESEANTDGTYDSITVNYDEDNPFVINSVVDGVGREYAFIYNAQTGLLAEVKCLTTDGTPVKAGTTDVDLKTAYTYDGNRNLTGVTYPDGKTVTYIYDSNNNLIKVQNIDGYNIIYTYDALGKLNAITEYAGNTKGNYIELTPLGNRQIKVDDAYYGSTTYQFGVTGMLQYQFDEKGNYQKSFDAAANDESVFEMTGWETASENLLKNGSFETSSAILSNRAKHWSGGFERVTNDTAPTGNYVYDISSESAVTEFLEQSVEVKNVSPYTLSVDVKNATEDNADGKLYLKIIAKNSSNDTVTKMLSVENAEEWTRYSVTFNPVTENGTFKVTEITACIGFNNSQGAYYIDNVQLESGKGTADYNLIENGSFNNSTDKWSEAEVVEENIYGKNANAVKLQGGLPSYVQSGDNYVLEDSLCAITQNVTINGKKGDIYSLGGWFKGLFDDNSLSGYAQPEFSDTAPALTDSVAQLKVTYTYNQTATDDNGAETTEALTENFAVDFAPHNDGWQYAIDSFALKGDVEAVDVTIITKNILQDSFATGIELTRNDSAVSTLLEDEEDTDVNESEETEDVTENCTCGCEDCMYGENCPCTGAVNEACQCPECLRTVTSAKDSFGNIISNRSTNGRLYIESLSTFTSDGNNLLNYTDENGSVYGYNYDVLNGILKSVSNPVNGGTAMSGIDYSYDASGNVVSISSRASDTEVQDIQYVYTDDKLSDIITDNEVYRVLYDAWGQVLSVNIVVFDGTSENLVPLVEYTYGSNENRGQVKTVKYINSTSEQNLYEYSYNDDGTVYNIKLNNSDKHNINYDNLGVLTSIENVGGRTVNYTDNATYIYDDEGAIVYVSSTDDEGLVTEENYGISYEEAETVSDYDSATGTSTQTDSLKISDKYRLEQKSKTDWFGRKNADEINVYSISGDETQILGSIDTEYSYPEAEDGKTSLAVEKHINMVYNGVDKEPSIFDGYYYEYTSDNKIAAQSTLNADGTTNPKYSYEYDKLGQLVRYNDAASGKTYTYTYDSNGNILTKSVYDYTALEDLGTALNTVSYAYDAYWKDKLVSVGDETIVYDCIGNPTSYRGATLTWEGRTLTSYEDDEISAEYEYDENGMRYRTRVTNKAEGSVTDYEYVWLDGKLISIVYVSDGETTTAKYLYNADGEPVGMVLTNADDSLSTYYYLKNLQGDITHIVTPSGRKLVEFTYDAFGKPDAHFKTDISTVTGLLDFMQTAIACAVTPFGYRGYCYDSYTGLYYLQSRYYDPETGRFINADSTDYLGATGTLLSYNLFAYCENDPVNYVDSSGNVTITKGYTNYLKYLVNDDSFFYDPKIKPTKSDKASWSMWDKINKSVKNKYPNGSKFYEYYRSKKGGTMYYSYATAYSQDKAIRDKVNLVLKGIQKWVNHSVSKNGTTYRFSTDAIFVLPSTFDWKLALNGHNFYVNFSVTYNKRTKQFKMLYTVIAFDRYNFNKGEIFAIIPDSANGRFVTLGWAKNYTSIGQLFGSKVW